MSDEDKKEDKKFDPSNPVCPECGSEVEVTEVSKDRDLLYGDWKDGAFVVTNHENRWSDLVQRDLDCEYCPWGQEDVDIEVSW